MFCTHVAILATFLIFLICILVLKMAHDQFDSFEVEKHWSLESGRHSSSLTGIEVSHSKWRTCWDLQSCAFVCISKQKKENFHCSTLSNLLTMLVMLLAVTRLAHATLRKYYFFAYFIIIKTITVTLIWFRQECRDLDGTSNGMCADGYGVCCTSKLPISRPNPDSVQNRYHQVGILANQM